MHTQNLKSPLRRLSIAAVLLWPLSGVCEAAPEQCVRGEPIPVLGAQQPGITSHRFVALSAQTAREYVTLDTGESVDIDHGGCEYFVTTFRFSSKHILKNSKSGRDAFKAAAALLRRLDQLNQRSGFALAMAAGTLQLAAQGSAVVEFKEQLAVEGDGVDFLQAQVQVDAAGRRAGIGFVQISLFRGPL